MNNPNVYHQIADFLEEDPSRWTQHEFARNSEGRSRSTQAEDTTCFCLTGLIMKFAAPWRNPVLDSLSNIINWNDNPSRTVEEVIALFRKAGDAA